MNSIKSLRTKRGISQEELARELGVSRQTVVAIEKGNYTPSVALALHVGKYFRKSVEHIFYWE